MGRYIDWADVSARYPDFPTDLSADQATPLIEDAEGEVDARLAPRYAVPFDAGSAAPPIVRALAADLVYYRRIWASERGDKLKAYIDERFKALLDGTMALTNSAGMIADDVLTAWTDKAYRSAFGPDDAENWRPSQTAIDDAKDDRAYD